MKNDHLWIITKVVVLVIFAGLVFVAEAATYAVPVIVSMLVAFMIAASARLRKKAYRRDERTKKVGAYAAAYSWMITLMTVSFLFWVEHLGLYGLTVKQVVLIIGAVMLITQISFQWHFMRKGDV